MSLSVFINHHLLTQPSAPFREYARLACTCKELHALLGAKVQAHKWATFQPEFLRQLDFVDMFTAAHTISLVETETILFPIPGYARWYSLLAWVLRDWDFVKEVVTVKVKVVTPWPQRSLWDTLLWKDWVFEYVYDRSQSPALNLARINRELGLAAAEHMSAHCS